MNGFYRVLGVTLLLASLSKLSAPEEFLASLRSYALIPRNWLGAVADLVTVLELVVGLELLRRPGAAARLWTFILFSAFSLALGWASWKGLPLSCGCFGPLLGKLHSLPLGKTIHLGGNLTVLLLLLGSLVLEARPPKRGHCCCHSS
ncbi:MAG: hypothetical protein KF760_29370 [Candidatus Eremiobacteraeota bacterium]|nr:hypothetical protein [Candidatus Eremiobacteraeota bacterium]MCW5865915.1 hypothetical protein [Candidatus Eremiobacteraeota bacterium]